MDAQQVAETGMQAAEAVRCVCEQVDYSGDFNLIFSALVALVTFVIFLSYSIARIEKLLLKIKL